MSVPTSVSSPALPNGSGAAAILAAGIGCFALAILAIAAVKSALLKSALDFYKPTGPLSGATTVTILIRLLTWAVLEARWRRKIVALGIANTAAFVFLILGFLLTFPPISDIF
jgi:hypothetical protein